MPLSKSAALIHGMQPHHLDHLATLAIELDIPLIVTEPSLQQLAKKYYPALTTFLTDDLHLGRYVIENYDTLLSSLPRDLIDQMFFVVQHIYQKPLTTIWCPHGNSDKGHASYLMEALQKEKIALVYGEKMIDFLRTKNAYDQLDSALLIGNYRYHFYQKRATFYDELIKREILAHLSAASMTFLYAPTWQDSERSTSFFSAFPAMIEHWPRKWNLIVKLHPNLALQQPNRTELLIDRASKSSNMTILTDFPLIYPLLNTVDGYIGDLSSIGYDYLTFNKPMFFLNETNRNPKTDPGLFLFRCGHVVDRSDYPNLPSLIEKNLPNDGKYFQKIRQDLYGYVFGSKNWNPTLKTAIERALNGIGSTP
ncbi:MAG: CDP-glycerol glycerophosphotransferase family protein [Chlamydiota bacterium]